ncbi:MAG: TetR/AcrR family transcriptional regulator [Chloroflexota bacterium]
MPRSVKQNEEMRKATQTAVINSAMTLFARNGYAHTSTRAIAKEANISTGLMYHYFSGKEALLKAVFDNCMAVIDADLYGPCNETPQGRRIPDILHAIFDLLAEKAEFWSLFYMLRTQPSIMRVLGDDFRFRTAALRGCIEEELQYLNHSNPRIGAHLIYCFIEGTIQQYLLEPDNYPLEQVVGEIVGQYE